MKIAVICANGKAGKLIVEEAARRGHEVTAVVRGENRSAAKNAIIRDVFALTADDLKGFDAVVDAFGAWTAEAMPQHVTSLRKICDVLSGSPTRLYVVGGAGSLYLDAEHKTRLMDAPGFPDMFKPLAANMGAALDELRGRKDVTWTYLSPAADFRADGERTGKYRLSGEEFVTNANGESFISYADYAAAMLDVIESGKYAGERISVYAE